MDTQHSAPGSKPAPKPQDEEMKVQRLLVQYKSTGNQDAIEAVLLQYKPLVEKLSRRFTASGMPLEDLAQEGYIGLLHAVDHYDPDKNVKFITYATHCVAGQLRHFLRDRGQIIKEPAWLQELSQRVRRATDSLSQQLGRKPTTEEIAEAMGLPEETISEIEGTRSLFSVASLEESFDSSSRTLAEREGVSDTIISDTGVVGSFEMPVDERVVLEEALTRLKELERRVVYMFFYEDHSQTHIAKELGISNNYVSHILKTSAKKLQQVYRSEAVRDAALQYETKRLRVAMPDDEPDVVTSIVDELTSLYSRAYYEARLNEELSRALRHGLELSVVRVEVDGAKSDAELFVKIGAAVKETLRRSDIVARLADNEIAAVLPYTGESRLRVAERLTDRLEKLLKQTSSSFGYTIGTAAYPPHRKASLLLQAALPVAAS